MDFAAIGAYPFGEIPNAELPTYQKSTSHRFKIAYFETLGAVYLNTRRVRECYQQLVALQAAPVVNIETLKRRLLHTVSIYCLISANSFAFGFTPGATEDLIDNLYHALQELQTELGEEEMDIETITLSSEGEAGNMADIEDNLKDEDV